MYKIPCTKKKNDCVCSVNFYSLTYSFISYLILTHIENLNLLQLFGNNRRYTHKG